MNFSGSISGNQTSALIAEHLYLFVSSSINSSKSISSVARNALEHSSKRRKLGLIQINVGREQKK